MPTMVDKYYNGQHATRVMLTSALRTQRATKEISQVDYDRLTTLRPGERLECRSIKTGAIITFEGV